MFLHTVVLETTEGKCTKMKDPLRCPSKLISGELPRKVTGKNKDQIVMRQKGEARAISQQCDS